MMVLYRRVTLKTVHIRGFELWRLIQEALSRFRIIDMAMLIWVPIAGRLGGSKGFDRGLPA
jgi:hypothetical protein